jgi:hypothetical protein
VAELVRLVDGYELWKDDPWYHAVDWQRVADLLDDVLQRHCRDGVVDGRLEQLVGPVERTLSRTDHEGLAALIGWPVEITRHQLHNGGHRTAAMLLQGVRFVPGRCMRGDVGTGIDSGQVYPVQDADRGGRFSSENCQ